MNTLEKYDIPFVGLKLGLHIFTYQVDGELLSLVEESPISECDIAVQLEFVKRESVFELGFNLSGTVDSDCDRCNDTLKLSIEDRFKVLIKFKSPRFNQNENDDPDIIFIERNETHLNVGNLIYEFLILSMPMYKIHEEDENGNSTCNPAIMQWLEGDIEEDNNEEAENEISDPRWEALRKLKEKK